eukprot:COSAG04_NODE_3172_length_3091_cov_1.249332_2_plen_235_part_00
MEPAVRDHVDAADHRRPPHQERVPRRAYAPPHTTQPPVGHGDTARFCRCAKGGAPRKRAWRKDSVSPSASGTSELSPPPTVSGAAGIRQSLSCGTCQQPHPSSTYVSREETRKSRKTDRAFSGGDFAYEDVESEEFEGAEHADEDRGGRQRRELPVDPLVSIWGVERRGRVLGPWPSCRLFLGPGFRLAARWNRLGETVKTRKKREFSGKKWARYGLRSVNKEGRGRLTWVSPR